MAELADALDSGSSEQYAHAGSSPVSRTSPSVHKDTRIFLWQSGVMDICTASPRTAYRPRRLFCKAASHTCCRGSFLHRARRAGLRFGVSFSAFSAFLKRMPFSANYGIVFLHWACPREPRGAWGGCCGCEKSQPSVGTQELFHADRLWRINSRPFQNRKKRYRRGGFANRLIHGKEEA